VKRDVVFIRFRKVNREGAEVTSTDTRASDRESTTSNSRQSDSRNTQIVRSGRPKSLSGRNVATDVNWRRY